MSNKEQKFWIMWGRHYAIMGFILGVIVGIIVGNYL